MLSAKVAFAVPVDSVVTSVSGGKIMKFINQIFSGNEDRSFERPIDISFAGAPFYSKEASFGVGVMTSGLFRTNRADSTMLPSEVSLSLMGSIKGMCVLTGKGTILFPDHRSRISFHLESYRERLRFWGINSAETSINPESRYDRRQIDFTTSFTYRLMSQLFIGATLRLNYTDAINIASPEYLHDFANRYYVSGIGPTVEFDSRNNYLYPTSGIHFVYQPLFYLKPLGNAPSSFISQKIIFNSYSTLWPGSVLATDFYCMLNSDKVPWTMYELVNSDGARMRGYYMGRFMDRNQVSAQFELRQHIYDRFGAVAWIGASSLFSSIHRFSNKNAPQWLHNFGIGLRFEFKKNLNIRVDYGFGLHTSGVVFAIGEAF